MRASWPAMSGGSWRSRHPGQGSARGLKGRLLLVADHLRGGRGDRQPPEPVGFVVVVDQDGCLAVVGGQAVQRQRDDILGPPTGGDEDLDRGAHARGGQVPRWSQTCRRISGGRSRPGSPCSGSSGMSPGLRATWLVSPAVGPPDCPDRRETVGTPAGDKPAGRRCSDRRAHSRRPGRPGHADHRAVLDLPAATPGPEGNDQPCPARNAGDARTNMRRETAGSP
jgi:hypothetical protein